MAPEKDQLDGLRIDRSRSSSDRAWWRWGLLVMLLLVTGVAGVAGVAWWWSGAASLPEVRTTQATESLPASSRTVLNASGYVTARREATVSSKTTGKIVDVLIEEGMQVEAGQVLATLDSANVKANLRLAESRLAAARSALEETRVLLDEARRRRRRIENLFDQEIASESERDAARAEADSLSARLDSQASEVSVAEQEVEVWRQEYQDTIIRAPFAGVVVSKDAQPGEMISPVSAGGGFTRTGIGTIVDMESLEIEVDVNESYINRVAATQPVEATLDAYPDWKIPCRVIAIIPTADRQKATVRVRIGFERLDPRILPDMGVKVSFRETSEEEPAGSAGVLVPRTALVQRDGRDVIFVVQDERVERRAVTAGSVMDDGVWIVAGLAAGERVVVDGAESLADGDRVKVTRR